MTKLTIPTADTFEYMTTSGNTLTLDLYRYDNSTGLLTVTNDIIDFVFSYKDTHIIVDTLTNEYWLSTDSFDYIDLEQDTHLTTIISTIHKRISDAKVSVDTALMFLDHGKNL